jgi:hypothetical protein
MILDAQVVEIPGIRDALLARMEPTEDDAKDLHHRSERLVDSSRQRLRSAQGHLDAKRQRLDRVRNALQLRWLRWQMVLDMGHAAAQTLGEPQRVRPGRPTLAREAVAGGVSSASSWSSMIGRTPATAWRARSRQHASTCVRRPPAAMP